MVTSMAMLTTRTFMAVQSIAMAPLRLLRTVLLLITKFKAWIVNRILLSMAEMPEGVAYVVLKIVILQLLTVRLVLIGGCYGDEAWTKQKEDLQKSFKEIPGIAGFSEKALTTFKQYSIFEIDIILDLNENNKPDTQDIKSSFSTGKKR